MGRRLLILGAGGHRRAVAALAAACGWTVAGFTDRREAGALVLGGDADLPTLARSERLDAGLVGVGNTALGRRAELFQQLRESGLPIPTLVHSHATRAASARLGAGSLGFPAGVLGARGAGGGQVGFFQPPPARARCPG